MRRPVAARRAASAGHDLPGRAVARAATVLIVFVFCATATARRAQVAGMHSFRGDAPALTTLTLAETSVAADVVAECTAASGFVSVVRLSNGTATFQAYKCKTNAPRHWSVKPNGGVIGPGEDLDVIFKLKSAHPGIETDRHLVLTAPVTAEEAQRLREQREARPRSSPETPGFDTPGVS